MLPNCPVSCEECDVGCADLDSNCPLWRDAGECTKNEAYMNIYCKKSCTCDDVCEDQVTKPTLLR